MNKEEELAFSDSHTSQHDSGVELRRGDVWGEGNREGRGRIGGKETEGGKD